MVWSFPLNVYILYQMSDLASQTAGQASSRFSDWAVGGWQLHARIELV